MLGIQKKLLDNVTGTKWPRFDIMAEIEFAITSRDAENMAKVLARARDEIHSLRLSHARAMANLCTKGEIEHEIQLRRCQTTG